MNVEFVAVIGTIDSPLIDLPLGKVSGGVWTKGAESIKAPIETGNDDPFTFQFDDCDLRRLDCASRDGRIITIGIRIGF